MFLESFGMNGFRQTWGQITVIFKEKEMFSDYCTDDGNCSERNTLFNLVFQFWLFEKNSSLKKWNYKNLTEYFLTLRGT